jgi:hypothetical protein
MTLSRPGRLRDWLTLFGSILLPAGVLVFAIQYSAYQSFYGSLGVDPSDLGLSYARVLAGSTTLVSTVLIAPFLGFLMVVAFFSFAAPSTEAEREPGTRTLTRPMMVFLGLFVAAATAVYPIRLLAHTGDIGSKVRAGQPVTYNGGAIIPMHADPVTVQPAGKPDDAPALKLLQARNRLLYLGQSNGTVVIYDPDGQHAVFLPASAVIITVSNCRSKSVDDSRCLNKVY